MTAEGGKAGEAGEGGKLAGLVRAVLDFWLGSPDGRHGSARQQQWFRADPAFDAECRSRFTTLAARAAAGELDALLETPEGALALVLLLDQLPRNIHRGRPQAFAADAKARAVATLALQRGFDRSLPKLQRLFLYLPFEHSEDLADQERAVALFKALGEPDQLRWAERHREVIARFGRFPHRNAVLGRPSTPEEQAFLAKPGSAF